MATTEHFLPVPPNVVARVIRVAADPECGTAELAAVIKADPVLSAQVLKAVNSPYYGLRRKLSSVDRAVSFMGIRAVRNLVLCFGVRELAPPKSDYPLNLFWECSLRRASAAKALAKHLKLPEPEEFFTMGLCQDLGVLAIITASEEAAVSLAKAARQPLADRRRAEQDFGPSHDELGGELFEKWDFSDDIVIPVRFHHAPQDAPEEHRVRAQVAEAADVFADILEVDDKQTALRLVLEKLGALGIDSDDLSPLLDDLSAAVTEAADMLQIKVGHQPSYQEIAEEASQGLLALNMSYQSLTEQLQDSLKAQQQLASRLEQLNRDLERRATTDVLTGLPNRRAFDEALVREMERAKRLEKPLSLLMLDLDHFKKLNDTCGHQAGDYVLAKLGELILNNARACDFPCRYGGEEFVIILPHTPALGAQVAAERLRKRIEDLALLYEGKAIRVTASIGISEVKPDTGPRAGTLALRHADDALYEAKEKGRNRVVVSEK